MYEKDTNQIFVFGSNLAGRHGKGAAKFALENCGAIYGQGEGLQGNSYGIPTKGLRLQTLPLDIIENFIRRFVVFASEHPELEFHLTPIGCGLAGYSREQILPLVSSRLEHHKVTNVHLTESWNDV